MKRVWRISGAIAAQSELLFLQRSSSRSRTLAPAISAFSNVSDYRFRREICTQTQLPEPNPILGVISLFGKKVYRNDAVAKEDLEKKVLVLRDELVGCGGESEEVVRVLEEKGTPLFLAHANGAAFLQLLQLLLPRRHLALEVFNWRRKLGECGLPLTSEEYAKGIKVAGRTGKDDLALEWFTEATNKRVKTTATYNALMSAYMWNGLTSKCLSVFNDLKKDADCAPSVVTYNILMSVHGRLMMIDQMEATLQEMKDANLYPTLDTYNYLIGGYVTAWMWDSMENTFQRMIAGPVKPDVKTYLLLLRGYAHSGNLEKMEEIYKLVRHAVSPTLIRAMICAYVKSSIPDKLERMHPLLELIQEGDYRSWLNILLMSVYAQETQLEKMESSINEAFEHRSRVHSSRVMRSIGAAYYRCNALDKLSDFLKRAESDGWRVCRSNYHGMLILYAKQGFLKEMENTLIRMKNVYLDPTRKTYFILFTAYSILGERYKAQKVIGLMYKKGYRFPPNWDQLEV